MTASDGIAVLTLAAWLLTLLVTAFIGTLIGWRMRGRCESHQPRRPNG